MKTKNGGYVIVDLSQTADLYDQLSKAVGTEKPILVYGDDIPYYADSLTYDSVGDTYSITKGGQIINIDSSNTITKTGDKDGALISSIVDANGNARFIEGDITIETIEGITQTYGKWSLSGSHLMIVLALDLDNISFTSDDTIANVTLPDYIKDKIVPIYSKYVINKTNKLIGHATTDINCDFRLNKLDNVISVNFGETKALTNVYSARIQFDLLIDTE